MAPSMSASWLWSCTIGSARCSLVEKWIWKVQGFILYCILKSHLKFTVISKSSFIRMKVQCSLYVDNFYNKMLGKMQCNQVPPKLLRWGFLSSYGRSWGLPIQYIWLTTCFWRPSSLSSVLSSLSVLLLNKSKKKKGHHILLKGYLATRMLIRKPPQSQSKGNISRSLSPQASKSGSFQCHNFKGQGPLSGWDSSIYSVK